MEKSTIDNSEDYIRSSFEGNCNFHVKPFSDKMKEICGKPPYSFCLIHWIEDNTVSRVYRKFAAQLVSEKVIDDIHVIRAIRFGCGM